MPFSVAGAAATRDIVSGGVVGGGAENSSTSVRPESEWCVRHMPPPPRLAVEGNVTDRVKAMATAASAAEPPAAKTL